MSRKTYLDWDLDQTCLLPPSLRDWLAEDHLVYFVLDVVRSIDLSPIIEAISEKDPRGQKPYHPVMMAVTTDGTPKPSSQRNFTDPESSIMVGRHGFIQGYNCQAAVDGHRQVVVGADVTNASVDDALLMPMLREVERACGRLPDETTADTGYWNPEQVGQAERAGVETYVSVKRVRRSESGPPMRTGEPPDDLAPGDRMRWRLDTERGREVYARRKAVVEPVFGQIRVRQTFNRPSFRTLQAAHSEWKLVAACHNLWKLFAQGQQAGARTAA